MARDLLAIVGPTAAGKSEVSVLLAQALAGEIVSADSMQVYRRMDIGTAKPSAEERARVTHHLIDIIDPDTPFSVADYRARADAALAAIWEEGRQPLLVGGSGLYVRAVIDKLSFPLAPPNAELRSRLAQQAREEGVRALHARLAAVDPEAASRLHPNDEKRIIRALEVHAQTGQPISRLQSLDRRFQPRYNTTQFGLTRPRPELYRRIEERVDRMLAAGLVEEVESLLAGGCRDDLVAMKGLGYAQIAEHLRGACSLEEAVARLKRDTRRFAKRQLTWFRRDPRIVWVDLADLGGPEQVAAWIQCRWRERCAAGE